MRVYRQVGASEHETEQWREQPLYFHDPARRWHPFHVGDGRVRKYLEVLSAGEAEQSIVRRPGRCHTLIVVVLHKVGVVRRGDAVVGLAEKLRRGRRRGAAEQRREFVERLHPHGDLVLQLAIGLAAGGEHGVVGDLSEGVGALRVEAVLLAVPNIGADGDAAFGKIDDRAVGSFVELRLQEGKLALVKSASHGIRPVGVRALQRAGGKIIGQP